ncbi:group II intron maturase-specific domain-containing protein [Streptomyces sp. NPDC006906]|uniref:group II intron maturase-specific domain-containing protein n=1 Tax=Streptomyces sp. NPDC006906 TaxID=3154782 RepID=UPI0033E55989
MIVSAMALSSRADCRPSCQSRRQPRASMSARSVTVLRQVADLRDRVAATRIRSGPAMPHPRYNRQVILSARRRPASSLLEGLNRTLTGWATYFRHGAAKRTFNAVDHHAWHRVAVWLRRKHGIPSSQLKGFCDLSLPS